MRAACGPGAVRDILRPCASLFFSDYCRGWLRLRPRPRMLADVRALALRQDPSRRSWVIAWSLTLALHALAMIGLQQSRQWVPAPPQETKPTPIQLTFLKPPPANAEPKAPTYFTELPADRADQAPERADFLSNVTSRARDRVPGGDKSLPRMSGVTDAPSVALESGHVEPQPASTPTAQEAQEPLGADGKVTLEAPKSAARAATTPPVLRDGGQSSQSFPNESSAPGNSDIRQGEMDNPEGNAGMTGDVSLNTTEWEWAPWLQRFGRKLMRAWIAPPAYYMGVLKEGGWAVVEMEIARSGGVLRMDVLEEQGHPSLIRAATSALRSLSPTEVLPTDFPEKTLILRIRLIYPKIRPR